MPCSDGYGPTNPEIYERLNSATRAACELAKALKTTGCSYCERSRKWSDGLSKETKKWVKEHEKIDKARLEAEREEKRRKKLRKKALKKLTRKERESLDLA